MLIAALFAWIAKNRFEKQEKSEMIINGYRISKTPCMEVVWDMFGKGINSDSACSCFLSSYYDAIKEDSNEVKLFINGDIHLIEDPERSDIKVLFRSCVEKNVGDSSAKMHLTYEMKKR